MIRKRAAPDAATLLKHVQANPDLWCADFALKYLTVSIDTRDGRYTLKDRDGNFIEPQRVLDAIAWRSLRSPHRAMCAKRQLSPRDHTETLPLNQSKEG